MASTDTQPTVTKSGTFRGREWESSITGQQYATKREALAAEAEHAAAQAKLDAGIAAMLDTAAKLDAEAAGEPDAIDAAIALLTDLGYRVRPPSTRKPRAKAAPREYVSPDAVKGWVTEALATKFGTQAALARAIGLAVYGPIGAAVRGRPTSMATFTRWVDAANAAPAPEPKAPKAAPAPKAAKAPVAKAAKAAATKRGAKAPAKNSGGAKRAATPKAARAMGSGPVARLVANG